MNEWYIFNELGKQRYSELKTEAEKQRLLHSGDHLKVFPLKRHQRLINWLGGLLVTWGCRLQSRYEPIMLASIAGELQEGRPEPCTS